MTDHVPAQNHSSVPLSGSQTTDATASGGRPVVDDDLREQMARALVDCGAIPPIADDGRRLFAALDATDALLPVVTAHVAAERERAVAEVRALHAPRHWEKNAGRWSLEGGLDPQGHGECLHDGLRWPCSTIRALPAQED